jgi:hypothetical protein
MAIITVRDRTLEKLEVMDHPRQMEKNEIIRSNLEASRNRTFIQVDIGWWVIPNIDY